MNLCTLQYNPSNPQSIFFIDSFSGRGYPIWVVANSTARFGSRNTQQVRKRLNFVRRFFCVRTVPLAGCARGLRAAGFLLSRSSNRVRPAFFCLEAEKGGSSLNFFNRRFVMMDYQNGMVVNQRAVRLWPYLEHVIDRINRASEKANVEAITDVILDAGKLAKKIRRDVTVNMLREQLQHRLWAYRRETREVAQKRKKLQNPVGRYGRPLAANTLEQYASFVKCWPVRREKWKREIRTLVRELRTVSDGRGKVFARGGVALRVINGGRYPAKISYRTGEKTWRKIR